MLISEPQAYRRPDGSYSAIVGDQQGWVFTHNSTTPQSPVRDIFLGAQVSLFDCNLRGIHTYFQVNNVCTSKELRVWANMTRSLVKLVNSMQGNPVDIDMRIRHPIPLRNKVCTLRCTLAHALMRCCSEEMNIWTQLRLMNKTFYDVRGVDLQGTSLLLGVLLSN